MFAFLTMLSQLLFSLSLFDGLHASPRPANLASRWTNGQVLNASYLSTYFTQSRNNINSYTDYSIQSLVLGVNHTNGQFLDGNPNPVGNLFFWQSQNGWTGVSRWDHSQKKRDQFINVLTAQNGLARYPNDGFQQWGVPLVNTYNDDAAWAAMSNLEAYEAYGHPIFLERAIGVWEVSTRRDSADFSSSPLTATSTRRFLTKDTSRGQNFPTSRYSPSATGRLCWGESVSITDVCEPC